MSVAAQPRSSVPTAVIEWDEDSWTLVCSILAPSEDSDLNLRDVIDRQLNIPRQQKRAVVGDVDILLNEDGEPLSFELYTNPAAWLVAELPAPPSERAAICVNLPFDSNGIASLRRPMTVLHDPLRSVIAVRFAPTVLRWYMIADRVLAGLDREAELAELRFRVGLPEPTARKA